MKSLPLAAAALLFGTSALAFAPSTEPAAAPAVAKDPFVVALVEPTPVAEPPVAEPIVWTSEEAPAFQPASAVAWEPADTSAGDPDLDLAVDPDSTDSSLTGISEPEEPLDVAPAAETMAEADVAPAPVVLASADTAPRPAAQNYPACRPGPGDDRCIQLYEPGVRVALASWTQPTGGFADGTATAMADDDMVDTDMGEMPSDEDTVAI
jgi:hypothetical protein